jgi:hypothetical protein
MTPEELLASLNKRGASVRIDGGYLVVKPESLITPEELEFAAANADAIVSLLRAPVPAEPELPEARIKLDLNRLVLLQQVAEDARRQEDQTIRPPVRRVTFRVGDRYLRLEQLTARDVQSLRDTGHITDEEVSRWLSLQDKTSAKRSSISIF